MEPFEAVGRLDDVGAQRMGVAGVVAVDHAILELYDAQYRRSVRIVALTTGSSAVAEEIVQDAFLEVLRRWGSIRDPQAYLRRALMSRCNSWLRRVVVERRYAARVQSESVWNDTDVIAFTDALAGLSAKQRAAVVLRYDAGLSEVEIATALGCRPGTVKSLLSRARAVLKEVYVDDR
ncbi:MAG: polymerase, sigma-24 subunit, subfamily [Ilumatobacteraceae bacterium]|nr:polymerase, sigma-24 subunit, subfamily [Ilumatobacteraceae bacterium]